MPETHFKTTKSHLLGILLLVFTDVYFYTDSQIGCQTGTLQRAPRQENRETKNIQHFMLCSDLDLPHVDTSSTKATGIQQ